MRRVKIVGTIGPASESPEILRQLIAAGLDVARLNFSHGTHEEHARTIQAVREAADSAGRPIALLQDLQGQRIRIGALDAPLPVESGQSLTLTTDDQASGGAIPVTYGHLPADVKPGDRILIDDGLIELTVETSKEKTVRCRVLTGGVIKSHKGMNLPGVAVSAPTLGDKDREDLGFGLSHGVDYVGLSFVRGPEDIMAARTFMKKYGAEAALIAKIERPEAVERLEDIIAVSDGLMIARGDLAVECGFERLAEVQEEILWACEAAHMPVVWATQVLETLARKGLPSRAEITDAAMGERAECVMLNKGPYILEAMHTLADVLRRMQDHQSKKRPLLRALKSWRPPRR